MIFYKQFNLPEIPRNLLDFDFHNDEPPLSITDTYVEKFDYDVDHYLDGVYLDPPLYITKKINHPPLTQWLEQFFNIPFVVGLSIVQQKDYGRMIVHQDLTKCCILNYVIDPGGQNVMTHWYQESGHTVQRNPKPLGVQADSGQVRYEDLTLLDTLEGQPNKWYLIRTDVLHDVSNLNGSRILLQVKFTDFIGPDDFDKLINQLVY